MVAPASAPKPPRNKYAAMNLKFNKNPKGNAESTSRPTIALTPVHATGTSSNADRVYVTTPTVPHHPAIPILESPTSPPAQSAVNQAFNEDSSTPESVPKKSEDISLFFDWIVEDFEILSHPGVTMDSAATLPPATASTSLRSIQSSASRSTAGRSTGAGEQSLLANVLKRAARTASITNTKSTPKRRTRATNRTYSTTGRGTREQKYFDKHLHPDLILKRVLPYPGDYHSFLEQLVDKAMLEADYQPPPIPKNHALHSISRTHVLGRQPRVISGVQPNERIIHQRCATMNEFCAEVSSTIFASHNDWKSFLFHRIDPIHGLIKAVGDGYLYLKPDAAPSQWLREQLEKVVEHDLSPIMVWEYKLASCLDHEVWNAIKYLSSLDEDFPWVKCTNKCRAEAACTHNGRPTVTGRKTGFDSATSDAQPPASWSPFWVDTPAGGPLTKAKCILQQIWAELVAIDGTYVVLSNGNEEMIGMRHRDTQTFLISDVSRVARPSYFKSRCGLMMRALNDAIQRATRTMDELKARTPTLPKSYDARLYDNDGRSGNRKSQEEVPLHEILKLQNKFDSNEFVSLMWIRDASHTHLSALPEPPASFRSDSIAGRPGTSFSLYIHKTLKGAGRSFSCTRYNTIKDECRGPNFVAKFGTNATDTVSLEWEYNIYMILQEKGVCGLLRTFGLYKHEGNAVMFQEQRGNPHGKSMKVRTRDALEIWLMDLHDLGFTHGTLRADNILVDTEDEERPGFCVVGWKNANYFEAEDYQSDEAQHARLLDWRALNSIFTHFHLNEVENRMFSARQHRSKKKSKLDQ